jgi:uncharacterized protein YceK
VRRVSLALLCWLWVADSGCATIYTLSADRIEGDMYESKAPQSWPRLFSGVSADGYCIFSGGGAQVWPLCLLDLPLSLAGDLIVSPYKAYDQIAHGNYHPRCDGGRYITARRKALEAILKRCRGGTARPEDDCALFIAPDGTILVPLDGPNPCPAE